MDSTVERLFQGTSGAVLTSVADIRRALKPGTGIGNIRNTGFRTFTAGPAGSVSHRGTFGTQGTDCALAFNIKQAVIESFAHSASCFFADMFAYFFGDGGAVFAKDKGDFLEGCTFVQFGLDGSSVL